MSILKKSAFALAIAGAFALTTPAMASSFTGPGTDGAPVSVVYFTVVGGVANSGATGISTLNFASSDNLSGRTTGFGVRITLPAGVKFTAATAAGGLGVGVAGDAAITSGLTTNEITINVVPSLAGGVDSTKPIITLSDVELSGATALAAAGGAVNAHVTVFDPVSGKVLNENDGVIMAAVDPVTVDFTASKSPALIDVGANGTHDAKTIFSSTGDIGLLDQAFFDAGSIAATSTAGAIDASTGLAYTFAGDLSTTLTGSFNAFKPVTGGSAAAGVYLTEAACAATAPVAPMVKGTISADGSKVTFAAYATTFFVGGTPNVCFIENGKSVIAATDVNASTFLTTPAPASVVTKAQDGTLQPLAYNGSSIDVATFNPAGNTTQQSFLRVSNGSSIDGKVTITGVDDKGVAGAPVTFTLPKGESIQINSDELEAGDTAKGLTGALGAGTGKWRLNVTGEFSNMTVQSLIRNNGTGTVGNLTHADVK